MSYDKEWYEKNRTRERSKQRKYYRVNKDKIQARHKSEYDRRRKLIDEMKLSSGCVDCGYNTNAAALDFDHVLGEKKFAIGTDFCRVAWITIEKEIAKCEIRCANCHRIATATRRKIS